MYIPFKDLMFLHFLVGISITLFFAVRAYLRDNKPPRWLADFGSGAFGEKRKWIQWYSWALGFEIITSFAYRHTGLFYYEVGCSFFEAIALVIGAFVVDRLFDMFAGASDISLEIPHIHVDSEKMKATVEEVKRKADKFKADMAASVGDTISKATNTVKTTTKAPEVDKDVLAKENKAFDDLIKGR